jgi:hypothetical protein
VVVVDAVGGLQSGLVGGLLADGLLADADHVHPLDATVDLPVGGGHGLLADVDLDHQPGLVGGLLVGGLLADADHVHPLDAMVGLLADAELDRHHDARHFREV